MSKKYKNMTAEEQAAYREQRRKEQEAQMPTPELIAKMERSAATLLKFYGPAEARRQMENVLAQVGLMAEHHSGFTEAVLAMGAKLDELIEK
jgi:hypothetical protein